MTQFVEIPASTKSLANRKLIHGIGTNDANYLVNPVINKITLRCPYYTVWSSMIRRCYSSKFHDVMPTYKGCTVVSDWHVFSVFKAWMKTQNWKGKELDKDILIIGNKSYGPSSCVFVSGEINKLMNNNPSTKGDFPTGVAFDKKNKKYVSQCKVGGANKKIGRFLTIEEAEYHYLIFKSKVIIQVTNREEVLMNNMLKESLLDRSKEMLTRASKLFKAGFTVPKGGE